MAKKKIVSDESRLKRLIAKVIAKKRTLFIGVLVVLVIQFLQVQALFAYFYRLELRDSSLITEVGDIKGAYTGFADDLNEIRNYLRLPTKNYLGFDDPENEKDADANQNDLQLAIFNYADYLAEKNRVEQVSVIAQGMLQGLTDSEEVKNSLAEMSLSLSVGQSDEERFVLDVIWNGEVELFSYWLDIEEGNLYRTTPFGEDLVVHEGGFGNSTANTAYGEFEEEFLTYVERNEEDLKGGYEFIVDAQETINAVVADSQSLLNEKQVTMEQTSETMFKFKNAEGEVIGSIEVDAMDTVIEMIDSEGMERKVKVAIIKSDMPSFLESLDTLTLIDRKVADAIKQVESTMEDDGFQLLLSSSGLQISEQVREDDIRYYYDILSEDGTLLSSIVVEKTTGVINVVDAEGTNAENILFFDPEVKKKTLNLPDNVPDYNASANQLDDDGFNILVAGKHGNLVDTMIFMHIDEQRGDIRLVSIPRDLQYNGRKINSFAHYYGMEELKKVLSEITGYELDKYVLIDMYAFIDVIDLIGGIDITLTSSVVDPYYRTEDDGKVGTLHYEPGDYHLGGKEALRLARSRKTSSDFARAERQQMILEAIQDKAQNFGFGDADTIYSLAKTVLDKVETDVSIDEAIAYYFRYQNYEMTYNRVMSSGNVLYSPPYVAEADCNAMVAAAQASGAPDPGCSGGNHAYILIPRNEDWNIIKWYFREVFEPETPEV